MIWYCAPCTSQHRISSSSELLFSWQRLWEDWTRRKIPLMSLIQTEGERQDHVILLSDGEKRTSGESHQEKREGEEFLGSSISGVCGVGRPTATLTFRSHTRLQTTLSPGRRGMRDSGEGTRSGKEKRAREETRPARQTRLLNRQENLLTQSGSLAQSIYSKDGLILINKSTFCCRLPALYFFSGLAVGSSDPVYTTWNKDCLFLLAQSPSTSTSASLRRK